MHKVVNYDFSRWMDPAENENNSQSRNRSERYVTFGAARTAKVSKNRYRGCTVLLPLLYVALVTASAQEVLVEHIEVDRPAIDGSQCEFSDNTGVILKSDWAKKFWMKIDGTLIELDGTRTDAETASDVDSKRWHETFHGDGVTGVLDLRQTNAGEDTSTYTGSLLVMSGEVHRRFVITGGCNA
jgi:hypothetical protein